ncbi:MAG: mycofactocin system FadH/OYE family oxidoreductase 1 [Acidimicrobiaceae bacterium]|nr:mycofactocin system FadH/OYE family oxidoreductase 1 [Acidimicrobiaceae bacterium]MCO5331247.1 mycofactocin system FadH/OYE family oxidoreductase 1 [Ilumatobacteraceae bacterium]
MRLLQPLTFGPATAANRVMFGPHFTNLGDDDRRFTSRHTAYYERRARGGCGIIVTEGASVHDSDWPYERAPLAAGCGPGWAAIATACHAHGALVLASLDHAGGQGSSAYSQRELWAPSRVPEVNTREVPKWMEAEDIAAVVAGFGAAAATAVGAGCDGVEINAGQHSLVRQFLSGLTNHRDDVWGADRWLFASEVIEAVRAAVGDRVVGLRMSCDELAPWAGITPEQAPELAARLVGFGVDYVVVVRGSIYSAEKTRADVHEPTGYNIDVTRAVKAALGDTPVFLQGSVVDAGQAEWALEDGVCDGVEMTRAQLADPDLVAKVRDGLTPRPCLRCNQTCQVRDARNPIVTCVGEPTTGRETEDPDWYAPTAHARDVLVVGGGVAGMETARVAARRGHTVRLVERSDHLGGMAALTGPGGPLVEWLAACLADAGVEVLLGTDHTAARPGDVVVQCTGSQPGRRPYDVADGATVLDVVDVRRGTALPDGPIALFDPIGGPIAVALAEELGERAILITQDQIAGNELSRTGDLAPANVRLQQRGVQVERRAILRAVRPGEVELEDRFSGERRTLPAAALVDCGFRLPDDPLPGAAHQAGDCVAPRTIHEAVLEGRRVALAL